MGKLLLIFILFICNSSVIRAQTDNNEAALKAVFIYNFTRYIDWDSSSMDRNFVIGVIGPSDVIRPLTDIAASGTVNNRRIVIQPFSKPEEIGNCQVLFIPKDLAFPLPDVLNYAGRGVLTVSESPGFARRGTAFNFVVYNNKLKFEANLKTIAGQGLKAGSQLLKLAIIVN